MNKIKLFLVGILSLGLVACTLPTGLLTSYVSQVCNLSVEERALVRHNIDSATYPHVVRIDCHDDE